jgi:hypothetical protein
MAQHRPCHSFHFYVYAYERNGRSDHLVTQFLGYQRWSSFGGVFYGRQGALVHYFLEYFVGLRTNRVMISSLECFRIGAKGYHIYFYSPLLARARYQQPG